MGDWWDTAREAFPEHGRWVLLTWPAIRMWKLLWQMVIFAMRKDLYVQALLDLDREQADHERERERRIEAEEEADRLRKRLDGFYDSRYDRLAGNSSSIRERTITDGMLPEDRRRADESAS